MSRKVLIVEDSGMTRIQVGDLIREYFDAEVLEAEDGVQGWKLVQETADLDLIVTDIEMPEMDGVGFIRRVRSSDEHSFIPILVMTTLSQTRQRDDALNAGADAFIQKPVTLEALRTILEDVW